MQISPKHAIFLAYLTPEFDSPPLNWGYMILGSCCCHTFFWQKITSKPKFSNHKKGWCTYAQLAPAALRRTKRHCARPLPSRALANPTANRTKLLKAAESLARPPTTTAKPAVAKIPPRQPARVRGKSVASAPSTPNHPTNPRIPSVDVSPRSG